MKKHIRLTALALCGLLALCLTACSDETVDTFESVTEPESTDETELSTLSPQELASEIENTTVPVPVTEAETAAPTPAVSETTAPAAPAATASTVPSTEAAAAGTTVPGSEPADSVTVFGVSTFLGKSTDGTERYFLFNTPLGGSCIAQQDGASVALTYVPQDNNMILFNMGGTVCNAEMSRIDANTIILLWDNGVTETLTKMPNNPNEPFVFYSTDDLCQRALAYYEQKTGYRPSQVSAMLQVDGTVAIQLYDNLIDHNTTSDWYTIDRYTGIGTNVIGEKIDLSQVVLG